MGYIPPGHEKDYIDKNSFDYHKAESDLWDAESYDSDEIWEYSTRKGASSLLSEYGLSADDYILEKNSASHSSFWDDVEKPEYDIWGNPVNKSSDYGFDAEDGAEDTTDLSDDFEDVFSDSYMNFEDDEDDIDDEEVFEDVFDDGYLCDEDDEEEPDDIDSFDGLTDEYPDYENKGSVKNNGYRPLDISSGSKIVTVYTRPTKTKRPVPQEKTPDNGNKNLNTEQDYNYTLWNPDSDKHTFSLWEMSTSNPEEKHTNDDTICKKPDKAKKSGGKILIVAVIFSIVLLLVLSALCGGGFTMPHPVKSTQWYEKKREQFMLAELARYNGNEPVEMTQEFIDLYKDYENNEIVYTLFQWGSALSTQDLLQRQGDELDPVWYLYYTNIILYRYSVISPYYSGPYSDEIHQICESVNNNYKTDYYKAMRQRNNYFKLTDDKMLEIYNYMAEQNCSIPERAELACEKYDIDLSTAYEIILRLRPEE